MYCTGALYTFSYTVSTNESRLRRAVPEDGLGGKVVSLDLGGELGGVVDGRHHRRSWRPPAGDWSSACCSAHDAGLLAGDSARLLAGDGTLLLARHARGVVAQAQKQQGGSS